MKDPRKTLDLAMLSSVDCALYPFDAGHTNRVVNGIIRAFLKQKKRLVTQGHCEWHHLCVSYQKRLVTAAASHGRG
jgi:hypothetical protein